MSSIPLLIRNHLPDDEGVVIYCGNKTFHRASHRCGYATSSAGAGRKKKATPRIVTT